MRTMLIEFKFELDSEAVSDTSLDWITSELADDFIHLIEQHCSGTKILLRRALFKSVLKALAAPAIDSPSKVEGST